MQLFYFGNYHWRCWSRRYAERICCEFFILVRRILGKLPANFSANFDGKYFGLVFPGFQATPKNSRPKFTSRIVGIPLQFTFLNPNLFTAIFCLGGRPLEMFYYFPYFHCRQIILGNFVCFVSTKENSRGNNDTNIVLPSKKYLT